MWVLLWLNEYALAQDDELGFWILFYYFFFASTWIPFASDENPSKLRLHQNISSMIFECSPLFLFPVLEVIVGAKGLFNAKIHTYWHIFHTIFGQKVGKVPARRERAVEFVFDLSLTAVLMRSFTFESRESALFLESSDSEWPWPRVLITSSSCWITRGETSVNSPPRNVSLLLTFPGFADRAGREWMASTYEGKHSRSP